MSCRRTIGMMRAMKIPAWMIARLGMVCLLAGWAAPVWAEMPPRGLRVAYFPEAAYADEPATFVLDCTPGQPVRVSLDSEKLMDSVSRTNRLEISLMIDRSGILSFRQGEGAVSFDVVQPKDEVRLREAGGFLHTDHGPAILLATHRHPPKHDRRWETLSFVMGLFGDDRRIVSRVDLICPASLTPSGKALPLPGPAWKVSPLPNASREIHALLCATNLPSGSELQVLVISDKDLEQGIDALSLRVKMEWFFQASERQSHQNRALILPTLTANQKERFSEFLTGIRLGAAGNQVVYLSADARPDGKGVSDGGWMDAVTREVGRRFNFGP